MCRTRWLATAGACLCSAMLGAQAAPRVVDGVTAVRRADSLWQAAAARGTRADSGTPGPRHWVQGARYVLQVELAAGMRSVRGAGLLRYRNSSPDTLDRIALMLAQNLFRAGAPHNEPVPVTGGMVFDSLCVARLTRAPAARLCGAAGGASVTPDLRVEHTVAWLTLPAPLAPGDSVDLRGRWHFTLPPETAPRMGTDGQVALIAYWYPQFAVYDDVAGWAADPYLAAGEFYMDPADYDVRITAPAGYLVAATGTLQNPAEVLAPAVRERLQRAARSFTTVRVVTDSLRTARGATPAGAPLTWRFTAAGVRDFAFYASREVVWDAMAALVPRGGTDTGVDTVLVHAFYRPSVKGWRRAADYGRQSIELFSRTLWRYPWPQMTLVEGIVDGGMEYPMLTAVSVSNDPRELLATLAHEIGHMWFPMQVGSNERRFAWMDEGVASWLERSLLRASTGHDDDDDGLPDLYRTVTRMRGEQSMLVHADHYSGPLTYTAASYDKLVVVFRAFAAEYGDSALAQGLRRYGRAWTGRHPYPSDFTRMVFAAAGTGREAFVREWVAGTGYFDARIEDVTRARDTLTVSVRVDGGALLSVPVAVTHADGRTEVHTIPAADFRRNPLQVLRIGGARSVSAVILDPARTRPDIDTSNQRWAP
ncbi:MAG: M1 family metallopeptidase [Gemmatimonadaceae bacterium]|nr:M1 family metallopeptidase [Gemmatimonadaceae bacterium]